MIDIETVQALGWHDSEADSLLQELRVSFYFGHAKICCAVEVVSWQLSNAVEDLLRPSKQGQLGSRPKRPRMGMTSRNHWDSKQPPIASGVNWCHNGAEQVGISTRGECFRERETIWKRLQGLQDFLAPCKVKASQIPQNPHPW